MKNRFVGVVAITFSDGYVEECVVKEKTAKGEEHFIKVISECALIILKQAPKGKVKFNYHGDLAEEIGIAWQEHLKETEQ